MDSRYNKKEVAAAGNIASAMRRVDCSAGAFDDVKGDEEVKHIAYVVLCLLALSGMCAQAGDTSYKTNTQVQFSGTFGVAVGLDANDKKEYYYYLKLDQPIDVADAEYGENETHITEIQLAIPFQVYTKTYKGKRITVKGTLFHSFTAHHHTKILMTVDKAGDLRVMASASSTR